MRELTVNRTTLPFAQNKIEYETVEKNTELSTEDKVIFNFTTSKPHGLTKQTTVILNKTFSDGEEFKKRKEANKYLIPTSKKVGISIIDDKTFSITFNTWELVEVSNMDESMSGAVLSVKNDTIYDYVNDTNNFTIKSLGKEYIGKQGLKISGVSKESFSEDNPFYLNEEDEISMSIVFDEPLLHLKDKGYVFVKNTWHLKDDNETFDSNNIVIFEDGIEMVTSVPISNSIEYKLCDDNFIAQQYINEVFNTIVPDIVDNERRQFLPAIAQGSTFKLATSIEFNLHFRQRTDNEDANNTSNNWKTDDFQLWNGFKWKLNVEEGTIERTNQMLNDDYGDEVNCLGFTEDDVKYQKSKIKKTFLRLMFYSNKNMLDKELLFYSTIFLDSGRLYTKYGAIKNNVDKFNNILEAFDSNRTDNSLRLDTHFSVSNKYNTSKSSEGFYLYLFPNEVEGENIPRTIYMKVEFNHAGYGKTVSMMLPRERHKIIGYDTDGTPKYGSEIEYGVNKHPIESTSERFPTSFVTKEKIGDYDGIKTDVEYYTDSVMIPVNIIYNTAKKAYLYYFPWYNRADENNKIIINLWEPRMRGNVNGTN